MIDTVVDVLESGSIVGEFFLSMTGKYAAFSMS